MSHALDARFEAVAIDRTARSSCELAQPAGVKLLAQRELSQHILKCSSGLPQFRGLVREIICGLEGVAPEVGLHCRRAFFERAGIAIECQTGAQTVELVTERATHRRAGVAQTLAHGGDGGEVLMNGAM